MEIVQLILTEHQDLLQLMELLDAYSGRTNGSGDFQNQLATQLGEHNNCIAYVARDGQRAVGVVVGFLNVYIFRAMPYANVHFIYVLPEQQGKGLGRALMQAFEDHAIEKGCCKINLEVRQGNQSAKKLYSTLNYMPAVFGPQKDPLEFWEKNLY